MCGRYTLSIKDFSKHYGVEQGAFEFSPSCNITPTQSVPVVLEQEGERTSVFEPINTHFRLPRHLLKAPDYRQTLSERFSTWQEVAELAAPA